MLTCVCVCVCVCVFLWSAQPPTNVRSIQTMNNTRSLLVNAMVATASTVQYSATMMVFQTKLGTAWVAGESSGKRITDMLTHLMCEPATCFGCVFCGTCTFGSKVASTWPIKQVEWSRVGNNICHRVVERRLSTWHQSVHSYGYIWKHLHESARKTVLHLHSGFTVCFVCIQR